MKPSKDQINSAREFLYEMIGDENSNEAIMSTARFFAARDLKVAEAAVKPWREAIQLIKERLVKEMPKTKKWMKATFIYLIFQCNRRLSIPAVAVDSEASHVKREELIKERDEALRQCREYQEQAKRAGDRCEYMAAVVDAARDCSLRYHYGGSIATAIAEINKTLRELDKP